MIAASPKRMVRPRAVTALIVALALPVGLAAPSAAYQRPRELDRLDVPERGGSTEVPAARVFDVGLETSISSDGRFAAIATIHPLVPSDKNVNEDIYLRDLKKGTTELISRSPEGLPAVGPTTHWLSRHPFITPNGRYVGFASSATNLVPGDTNGVEDVFVFDRKNGTIQMVSLDNTGKQPALAECKGSGVLELWCSSAPSLSSNGRYVSFTSWAPLVDDDTNEGPDVFVRDRRDRKTIRVSVDSEGQQVEPCAQRSDPVQPDVDVLLRAVEGWTCHPHSAWYSSISANGRYVAFESDAQTLVEGDTNQLWDVFVHDLKTGKTERVSVASDGSEARGLYVPVISVHPGSSLSMSRFHSPGTNLSADGRFVAFESNTDNLIPNDANGPVFGRDLFVHDRRTGRTERISTTSSGQETAGGVVATITADGRFIGLMCGCDPEMLRDEGDATGHYAPFVYDRGTGALNQVGGVDDSHFKISASGRFGTFVRTTGADVGAPTHSYWRADLGDILGIGGLGGPKPGNRPSPPDDRICIEGTCIPPMSSVSFAGAPGSEALTRSETNLIGGAIAYRPSLGDLYVSLELESMPRTPALAAATAGVVYGMSFETGGRSYEIRAASTGVGSRGETTARFGLFDCSGRTCTKVSELKGGFGTTGERITFSVPLKAADLRSGAVISNVEAYTALGTLAGGATKILDRITTQ